MKYYRRKRYTSTRPAVIGIAALLGLTVCFGLATVRALELSRIDPIPAEVIEAPVVKQPEPVVLVKVAPAPVEVAPAYTAEELETLALVIYQEAGGDACSDETRRMVGTVVLNRVADDRYPDTIQEVALQRAQYGRLYWTGLEWPERASLTQEAHAVERAYDTAEALLNGERALPEDVVFQAEFTQGTEIVAHQDGMYFCR